MWPARGVLGMSFPTEHAEAACHNSVVSRILLVLFVHAAMFAQEMSMKVEIERDQALRRNFEAALAQDPESALQSLAVVIDRPWMAEVGFRDACTLAQAAVHEPESTATLAARLVLTAGLHNPALALRESALYLSLEKGRHLFERFVLAAPGEAIALASGNSQSARSFRQLMSDPGPPEFPFLIRLAEDSSHRFTETPTLSDPRWPHVAWAVIFRRSIENRRRHPTLLRGRVRYAGRARRGRGRVGPRTRERIVAALSCRTGEPPSNSNRRSGPFPGS